MPDLTGRASSASSSSPSELGGGWVAPRAETTLPLPSNHTYAWRVFDHFQVNILTRGESPSSSKAALLRARRQASHKQGNPSTRAESVRPLPSNHTYARRVIFQLQVNTPTRGDRPPTSKETLLRAESLRPVASNYLYARRQLIHFREC
jgi:hypothetical protein